VAPPVTRASTFAFATHAEMLAAFRARESGTVYTRYNNPTFEAAERRLQALEGSEAALLFSSGMAAITSAVLSVVGAGARALVQREIYGGSFEFFRDLAPRMGIEVDWFSLAEPQDFEAGMGRAPRLVYLESPTNPHLRCLDLARAAARARAAGATTVCDATFATPFNQRPLALGIDLVVHSATKYLAGHADLLAGAVAGSAERMRAVWKRRKLLGGAPDPETAFLLERSLRTFALRMARHNQNGLAVATFLEAHPVVERVYYPGLPSHPDHAVARRQMTGFGGMVTVVLAADLPATIRFVEALRLFRLAPSLGGVESLVCIPATSSHLALAPEERQAAGIPDGMVRLSLGVEDAADLVSDLERALAAVRSAAPARAPAGTA
jgi:cystathionine gamma-synthase